MWHITCSYKNLSQRLLFIIIILIYFYTIIKNHSTLKSISIPSNLFESSGNCDLMSSDPIKMASRYDHVRCTSNQMAMTWSAVESFCCHDDTWWRKCAMYLDVIRFCSCTCWEEKMFCLTSVRGEDVCVTLVGFNLS